MIKNELIYLKTQNAKCVCGVCLCVQPVGSGGGGRGGVYGLFHPRSYSGRSAKREARRRKGTLLWWRRVSEVPQKIDSVMGV